MNVQILTFKIEHQVGGWGWRGGHFCAQCIGLPKERLSVQSIEEANAPFLMQIL